MIARMTPWLQERHPGFGWLQEWHLDYKNGIPVLDNYKNGTVDYMNGIQCFRQKTVGGLRAFPWHIILLAFYSLQYLLQIKPTVGWLQEWQLDCEDNIQNRGMITRMAPLITRKVSNGSPFEDKEPFPNTCFYSHSINYRIHLFCAQLHQSTGIGLDMKNCSICSKLQLAGKTGVPSHLACSGFLFLCTALSRCVFCLHRYVCVGRC